MARVTTPTVHFIMKNRPDKSGKCPILLIIRYFGRAERSTGVKCRPSDWDVQREAVRPSCAEAVTLNVRLSSLRADVDRSVALMVANGSPVSAAMLADRVGGGVSRPSAASLTVEAAYAEFAGKNPLRPNTVRSHSCSLRRFKKYSKGSMLLTSVTPSVVKGWIESMRRDGLAELSIKQYVSVFRAVVSWSSETYSLLIDVSSVVDSALRKVSRKVSRPRKVLTKNNIQRIIEYLYLQDSEALMERSTPTGKLAVFVCCYLLSGLAPIDMALLTLQNIEVRDSCVRVFGWRRKTGRPFEMYIPMVEPVERILMPFIRSASSRDGYVFPILFPRGVRVDVADGDAVASAVLAYCRDAARGLGVGLRRVSKGLSEGDDPMPSGITLYSARHSYATNFISASGNLKVLAKSMGRSPLTLMTYIHDLMGSGEMLEEASKVYCFG